MLIGVQALDLAPKKAAGTAAGLTGFFGYFFGTAILANIAMGSIVQHLGWDWGFIMLLAACALAFLFISFTYREEQYLVKQRKERGFTAARTAAAERMVPFNRIVMFGWGVSPESKKPLTPG